MIIILFYFMHLNRKKTYSKLLNKLQEETNLATAKVASDKTIL